MDDYSFSEAVANVNGTNDQSQLGSFSEAVDAIAGTDNSIPSTPVSNSAPQSNTSYITKRAIDFGLDPQAVVGVAQNEGLSGAVGDNGTSFGPFQLHAGGALPQEVWQQGPEYAQKWAWSPEGIDYALGQMAQSAKGLKGMEAVRAIVLNFERPADPTGDLNSGYRAIEGE